MDPVTGRKRAGEMEPGERGMALVERGKWRRISPAVEAAADSPALKTIF
jgi:hypothetical protein